MEEHPTKWKSLLRQAQALSVRHEAWTSSCLFSQNLLLRQMRPTGSQLLVLQALGPIADLCDVGFDRMSSRPIAAEDPSFLPHGLRR